VDRKSQKGVKNREIPEQLYQLTGEKVGGKNWKVIITGIGEGGGEKTDPFTKFVTWEKNEGREQGEKKNRLGKIREKVQALQGS